MQKQVMGKAIEIARGLEGDWIARMKMALKMAWALIKKGGEKVMEFIGSEKQVKWAEDVYPKAIEKIEEVIKEIEEYARKKKARSITYDHYIEFFEEMKEIKEAKFWIENFGYNKEHVDFVRNFNKYVNKRKEEIDNEAIYNRFQLITDRANREALRLSYH